MSDLLARLEALELAVLALAQLEFFDESEERDNNGRWTAGGNSAPLQYINVKNVKEAIRELGKGHAVMLERPKQAVTLVKKLAEIAQESRKHGVVAPNYDLCKVSVAGTNLFCAENLGIPRIEMPQLKGVPAPGSPGDSLPKDDQGRVNIGGLFKDYLAAKGIRIDETRELATRLRASQSEINGPKAAHFADKIEQGKDPGLPIVISKENYIVDGHHHYAAEVAIELGGKSDISMNVSRVDMPILPLLNEANAFAERMGIPHAGIA